MCTGSAEDAISFSPYAPSDKTALRRQARQCRRGLASEARARAEAAVCDHLDRAMREQGWRRIAAYAATASELDLSLWFVRSRDEPPTIHLPMIAADGGLSFRRWMIGSDLREGPHGIAQPAPDAAPAAPESLDAVLLPLLAFDDSGTRLGSGAGYYDRALAFRRTQAPPPLLVGIAFEAQRFDALPREPWDIPLDAIVTERGWRAFPASAP